MLTGKLIEPHVADGLGVLVNDDGVSFVVLFVGESPCCSLILFVSGDEVAGVAAGYNWSS